MADNVAVTEGAGKSIASDDVGGQQYQRVKLDFGTDGVAAPALAGTGVMATGVQRVTLATDDPATVLLGTIDADTGAIKTAVEIIDNAISGSEMQVDIVTVPAPLNVVGGGAEATALRVTLANDSTGVITVDGTVTANLSAIDNAVLDTIDAVLDTINAKLVTGTIIGDVNLGATDNAVLDQIELNTDPLLVVGGGTEATAIRVTIANDSTGLLSIDDGGGALTVDGTVTANLSATDNAVLDTIDAVLDTINAKLVTGTVIGDVNLGATDNAVLDAIAASLVTIDSDTNDIKTATEIMDDWDATHASAAPVDGAQVMGVAYSTALPTDVGADADAARLVTDRYGRLCTGLQPQAAKAIVDNADTTTAREIVAATATRRIFITSLIISVDTAGNYWLEDGDATAVTAKMYFAANGGCAITYPEGTPLNTVTQNKALNVKGSTAGNVGVTITYYLAV